MEINPFGSKIVVENEVPCLVCKRLKRIYADRLNRHQLDQRGTSNSRVFSFVFRAYFVTYPICDQLVKRQRVPCFQGMSRADLYLPIFIGQESPLIRPAPLRKELSGYVIFPTKNKIQRSL